MYKFEIGQKVKITDPDGTVSEGVIDSRAVIADGAYYNVANHEWDENDEFIGWITGRAEDEIIAVESTQ